MARVILDWDSKTDQGFVVSEILDVIRAGFSVENTSKKILRNRNVPTWHLPDFNSPITQSGKFRIGLFYDICDYLNKHKHEIVTTPILSTRLQQKYTNKAIHPLKLEYRPYQLDCIRDSLSVGYGVNVVGTAGGKTLIMAGLAETIRAGNPDHHTFILMPSNLVKQTYKEFLDFGIDSKLISTWSSGDDFELNAINIASLETLRSAVAVFSSRSPLTPIEWMRKHRDANIAEYNEYKNGQLAGEKTRHTAWKKRRDKIRAVLKSVDLVIVDEVHSLRKGNALNQVVDAFDTPHRFGFTGTMPSSQEDQWSVKGLIGPIITNVSSADLRDMNYIAQLTAIIVNITYNNPPTHRPDFDNPEAAYLEECEFLYNNAYRNQIITKLSTGFDNNSLILVNRLKHGESLKQLISSQTSRPVYFMKGEVDTDEREEIRGLMEKQNDIICIAMARIFAVGVNIKNLHYIVFALGGKAKVTIIQGIGRGLRLHENKECLTLFDISDKTHYGIKHLNDRIQYYNDERIEYTTKNLHE